MHKFKQHLKRIPGLLAAAGFLAAPKQQLKMLREFLAFKKHVAHLFIPPAGLTYTGRLLIPCFHGNYIDALKEELFFIHAARLAGLEPIVVTYRGSWATRFWKTAQITKFIYLDEFVEPPQSPWVLDEATRALEKIHTFDELMAYEYEGMKVGKYVCSTLVRKTYSGSLDVTELATREKILISLIDGIRYAHAALKIFDGVKPTAALFLERGYSPYGEFFDVAVSRKLNVIQWAGSHTDNALMLKRYRRENDDQHHTSLSPETWRLLKGAGWDKTLSEAIKKELYRNYVSGSWFSEVGTQFGTSMMEKQAAAKLLGIDTTKKTAVIFSHLFWDATFFWGRDLFANYRQWFIESVKAACKNTAVNWVLKLHPANRVKLSRDGYRGELIEITSLREEVGPLPDHIKILYPETPISTLSLYSMIDYCLTVRGTPGIEAAVFGAAVITGGTGRYDRHGFTFDSDTITEYLNKLAHIQDIPRLTSEQIELAEKFAFGTFILRPFKLESMRVSYVRDKKATQRIEHIAKTAQEFADGKDVRAFMSWVNAADEDYLDRDELVRLSSFK